MSEASPFLFREAKKHMTSISLIPPINKTRKPKTPFNTGITILTNNPKITLNIRSFMISTTSSVTSELQIKQSKARHGKTSLTKYVKKYNIPWSSVSELKKHSDDFDYMKNIII